MALISPRTMIFILLFADLLQLGQNPLALPEDQLQRYFAQGSGVFSVSAMVELRSRWWSGAGPGAHYTGRAPLIAQNPGRVERHPLDTSHRASRLQAHSVPPTRRDAIAPLHSQTRIGQDRHFADGTDRRLFSLVRLMGLPGWQRSKIPIVLSVASRPARELTVRSAKPGIKSTLDANCTDGDASLMITAQQRRHPHRQGLAAGALSG
jgi:hypothetical protein